MSVELLLRYIVYFVFDHTATTEIYTLSLHDALPIFRARIDRCRCERARPRAPAAAARARAYAATTGRRERQSSQRRPAAEIGRAHVELQSRQYLVCRLLLEKKKLY